MAHDRDEIERLNGALQEAERQAERDRATIEKMRMEAHEHQRETLRHVRSTLGVVRSIVCRTIADGETAEDFQARLAGRIASLARLQSHLFRNPVAGADLYSLIVDELLPFGIRLGTAASVEGDAISLKPRAASALGGAFHELARMGVESGGLASADGGLTVRWGVEADGDGKSCLWIDWQESGRRAGRPPSVEPEFGRDVEGAIAYELDGTVTLETTSSGLNCQLRLPGKWVVRSSPVDTNDQESPA